MSRGPLGSLLHQLLRFREASESREATDGELLARFATCQEQDAFTALVRRHGPLVWAVCRRTLPDIHEAEDAFQATFLVLAAKAGAIRRPELLHNWLYGVAFRVSKRLQRSRTRHRHALGELMNRSHLTATSPAEDEWRPVLDEELHRLPEKYRAPLLLCYMEGQTQEDAARRLGWTAGSVKGRLERAREVLRGRLSQRGITLSVSAIVAALPRSAEAVVPEYLCIATARAGCALGAGQTNALGSAYMLARETLRAGDRARRLLFAAVVLTTGLVGAGTGWGIAQMSNSGSPEAGPTTQTALVAPLLENNGPPAVSPEVFRAWREAGMRLFWYGKRKGAIPERNSRETDWTHLEGPIAFGASFPEMGAVVPFNRLPDPGVPLFLDLSHTRTTDEHLKELGRFKHVTHLRLIETDITDEGMKEIRKLTELRDLDVGHTTVSALGIHQLRDLPQLRRFAIGGNGANVTDAELLELTKFRDLTHLTVAGTDRLTDAGLVNIGKLTKLRVLYVGSPVITEVGLRRIAALDQLEWLGLGSTSTTDAGMKEITRLKRLRFLNVGFTRITDAGLRELRHFPELNILCLPQTRLTDVGLADIKQCRNLTELYLPQGISDNGLTEIKAALPKCKITREDDLDK